MTKVDYLIVGGGVAGTTAAETIRSKDPNSSVTIVTQEPDRLYSRVLLPHYLRNENSHDSVYLRTAEGYKEKNITLLTNTLIKSLDVAKKNALTEKGEEIGFEKLLIASGGHPRQLAIPGSNLKGVFYLRTLEDAKHIKEWMEKSKKAVVLGGGFIAIEFAQSFVTNNIETTCVVREDYFWETTVGTNSGILLSRILEENGVKVIPKTEGVEFLGTEKIEKIKLSDNSTIDADIVGIGVGIETNLNFLANSGLVIKKGIVTNEFLETSVSNVWAAGDVAEFYDPIFGHYHSLGNWANASAQGRLVGANMAGDKQAFQTTSLYSINIFRNNFSFLGSTLVDEKTEIIERGIIEDKKLVRIFLRGDSIVGASVINLPLERGILDKLIREKTKLKVSKEKLKDLTFDLNLLLS